MNELAATVVVAIVSAAAGYLIWAWQHRIRPWIAPLGFEESARSWERVPITQELASRINSSIIGPDVSAGSDTLAHVSAAYAAARQHMTNCQGSVEILADGIQRLRAATDVQTMTSALRSILRDSGISDTLEQAFLMSVLSPPLPDPTADPVIHFDTRRLSSRVRHLGPVITEVAPPSVAVG
jgi:hypothetical protein